MRYFKNVILLFAFISIILSCKNDSKNRVESTSYPEVRISDSKEFKSYFKLFFSLSNKDTKTDLPYVNKFMTENKLFKFKDKCDLLENKQVISDKKVFDFWKVRCEFDKAKQELIDKYQIDGDSIKILIQETIASGKYMDIIE